MSLLSTPSQVAVKSVSALREFLCSRSQPNRVPRLSCLTPQSRRIIYHNCFWFTLVLLLLSLLTTSAFAIALLPTPLSSTTSLLSSLSFPKSYLRRSISRLSPPTIISRSNTTNNINMSDFTIGPRAKILLLGSSMTQRSFSIEHLGWGSHLSNWFSRTADVLNRGSGGYNSRWLRQFLPQILASIEGKAPDMTIVFIGNNDSIDEREPQHVPLSEYRENIEVMLDMLQQVKPNMIVLLVSTTPVNEHLKPKHSNQRRRRYAEVLREIVRDHSQRVEELLEAIESETTTEARQLLLKGYHRPRYLGFVDLWRDCETLELNPIIGIEDLHDGSHLDKNGNRKVFEAIKGCINASFPFFSPDHLIIPRNHLRVRKSSFDGKLEPSSTNIVLPKKPYHPSHSHHSQSTSTLGGSKSSSEWWIEPSIQITLPPWHTLVTPDYQSNNSYSHNHQSHSPRSRQPSLVEPETNE